MNNSWQADHAKNVALYTRLAKDHGRSFRALNWGSVASQELRFEVIAKVGDLAGASVLDVGCGLADFWGWLSTSHIPVDYTGIDLTPAMVEKARERFPALKFSVGTVETLPEEETFDYIVASGIFYLRTVEPEQYLHRTIGQMFRRARKAVAFNSLSTWATQHDAGEFYADPLKTLDFCRTLTPWLALRHDYLPHDFTLYLYKEQPAA